MPLASTTVKGLLRPEELARYADAVVKVGLSLGRGDDLLVTCQPAHREFAVALVEAGYRVGARNVDVEYNDPLVRAAYLRTRVRTSRSGTWLRGVPRVLRARVEA